MDTKKTFKQFRGTSKGKIEGAKGTWKASSSDSRVTLKSVKAKVSESVGTVPGGIQFDESGGGMRFKDAIAHAKKHGNRVTYGTQSRKWHSIGKTDRDYHTSFALEPDEALRHGEAKSLLHSTQSRMLEEVLDVPTFTVEAIAKKHGVSVETIQAQLKKGIEVEKEHTTKEDVAREIALDHLNENPSYYTKLNAMKLEECKVGDMVVPKLGPHKGHAHEVIHVFDDGRINIKPKGIHPSQNRYRLGAATAKQDEVEKVVGEGIDPVLPKVKPKSKPKQIEVKGPGAEEKFQKDPTVSPLTTTYTRGL